MNTVNATASSRSSNGKRAIQCAGNFIAKRTRLADAAAVAGPSRPPGQFDFPKKSVLGEYANFMNSGLPKRIMFYSNGSWEDFPHNVAEPLIKAFAARQSAVEVSMGDSNCLFDFIGMVLIDLKTKATRSVSWIDESNKCFFPTVFLDGDDELPTGDIKLHLDIDIKGLDSSNLVTRVEVPNVELKGGVAVARVEVPNLELKEGVDENVIPVRSHFDSPSLNEKLVRLGTETVCFRYVINAFLEGLCMAVVPDDIVGIYRYVPKDSSAIARLQRFEHQVELLKRCRGDSNVCRGWLASSMENIVQIVHHGFGIGVKQSGQMVHGTGVYLTPMRQSRNCAQFCDVDEKGVQHIVLCRAILGRMEQIPRGSKQLLPTSDDFDSGVDDLRYPKHYIIWNSHASTHLYPEYVVSFKLSPSAREYLNGKRSKDGTVAGNDLQVRGGQHSINVSRPVRLPTSPWASLPLLFEEIEKNAPPLIISLLYQCYTDFQDKKIPREEFIDHLRLLLGDKLLKSILLRIHFRRRAAMKAWVERKTCG